MSDLINQLYDIATNEEFTEAQRKGLMRIVMDEAGAVKSSDFVAAYKETNAMGVDSSITLNIDETLGRSLTKERTPYGIRFGLSTFSPNE